MQGNYGSRFLDMWRTGQPLADGTDAGLRNARELWAKKLAGFAEHPERIGRALQCLPPHPPTLPEFVALCRQQYADTHAALPSPRMASEDVEPRIAEAAGKVAAKREDPLGWAKCVPNNRGAWERFIVELVEDGDHRFVPILEEHVKNRVIKSERARMALDAYRAAA